MSVIEVVVALGILAAAMLGAAGVFTQGMAELNSSPAGVIMTQKAAEAVEAVFAARDSHTLTWAQIRNAAGANNDGGVFLDGPQPLRVAGADGLVGTADDLAVESVVLPGNDQLLGTGDDITVQLDQYTREIVIRDIPNIPLNCGLVNNPCTLRTITIAITYTDGARTQTYNLTTYVSNWA